MSRIHPVLEVARDQSSLLIFDPDVRPLGNVVGGPGRGRGGVAQMSNGSRYVTSDEPVGPLIVVARGRMALVVSWATGEVRGPMSRPEAVALASVGVLPE